MDGDEEDKLVDKTGYARIFTDSLLWGIGVQPPLVAELGSCTTQRIVPEAETWPEYPKISWCIRR